MRALLLASLILLGCSGEERKTYPTYQECFDDKHDRMDKETIDSIVSCCIDHEIMGMEGPVCGADDPACINYLTANLSQNDADISIQTQACAAYVAAKAKN